MSQHFESEETRRFRAALEDIERYKRTPRAYRHTKFEHLIKIAQDALRLDDGAE